MGGWLRSLPIPWEALLLLVFLAIAFLVWRAVRRRRAYAGAVLAPAALPHLDTQQRVTGTVRRTFRDPDQQVWQVTISVGERTRLTFCATDYDSDEKRYAELAGKPADIALFALATLAPGGAEAMKEQIKDIDKIDLRPDLVTLTPAPNLYPNDYVVIGKVLSERDEVWDEMPLRVYRTQVLRRSDLTLVLDLAVPAQEALPNASGSMVHGSARLFGRLA